MKHVHIPDRGGERPRLPSAQVGPVTQAIRAMRAAEPVVLSGSGTNLLHGIRALFRAEVEDLIGGLIDILDAMDGDTDREPDTDHEPNVDREPDEQDGCAVEWTGRGAHYFNSGRVA